jgi:hypothetical protein
MFVLGYHLHWPLSELRIMATRERKWYMERLTQQIKHENEQTKKAGKKTSGTQFGGKPVGNIPRPPPTRE